MIKKSVSFDAMVHFFMKYYNIPTKRDIEKLMTKLDHLETMVKQSYTKANGTRSRDLRTRIQSGRPGMTASDTVLEIIKETADDGVKFAEIKDKTGFDDKKIRNIVFRLNKLGKIKRKNRGIYVAI
jgi:predicted Rossmann fold nucleotide-binding protein DprA/Smf involved in DNA uptake